VYKGVRALVDMLAGSFAERLASLAGVLGIFFRYWLKEKEDGK
jgi:hypothetical protein